MAAGKNTAANEIIQLAGAVNAIDGYEGYKPINDEAIIAAKPDVVLSMQRGQGFARGRSRLRPSRLRADAGGGQQGLHLDGRPLSARLRAAHGSRRARSRASSSIRRWRRRRKDLLPAALAADCRQMSTADRRRARPRRAMRPPALLVIAGLLVAAGCLPRTIALDRRRGGNSARPGCRRHSGLSADLPHPDDRRATSSCCGRSAFRASPLPPWSAACWPHPAPSCRACSATRWPIRRWSASPAAARLRPPPPSSSPTAVSATSVRFLQNELLPLAAFVGSLVTTMVLYRIASRGGRTSIAIFLLAGLAIAAIANAGIGLLVFVADDRQLRDITFWLLGSLSGATWPKVATLAPVLALAAGRMPVHRARARCAGAGRSRSVSQRRRCRAAEADLRSCWSRR